MPPKKLLRFQSTNQHPPFLNTNNPGWTACLEDTACRCTGAPHAPSGLASPPSPSLPIRINNKNQCFESGSARIRVIEGLLDQNKGCGSFCFILKPWIRTKMERKARHRSRFALYRGNLCGSETWLAINSRISILVF